jgi:cell division transport system permease protein
LHREAGQACRVVSRHAHAASRRGHGTRRILEIRVPKGGKTDEFLEYIKELEEWLQRLSAFVQLTQRAVMVLGLLLALAVVLVVGNTIRLSIESRRDEIIVAKLVGGTDAWVRRPFLYTGAWYGLLGAALAWCLIQFSLLMLKEPVAELARLYLSDFEPMGLGLSGSLILLLTSLMLGWLGAWLAVGHHLRQIEPS